VGFLIGLLVLVAVGLLPISPALANVLLKLTNYSLDLL
jgi:hypothetical protein